MLWTSNFIGVRKGLVVRTNMGAFAIVEAVHVDRGFVELKRANGEQFINPYGFPLLGLDVCGFYRAREKNRARARAWLDGRLAEKADVQELWFQAERTLFTNPLVALHMLGALCDRPALAPVTGRVLVTAQPLTALVSKALADSRGWKTFPGPIV